MSRALSRAEKEDLHLFMQYARHRLVYHPNLVVPLQVLYRDHVAWATRHHGGGLPIAKFKEFLEDALVELTERPRTKGILYTLATGVGVRP